MLMDIIKARHSIRKYTGEQIKRDDLEKILEAGNFAPNAGGGQRSMMVAIHNKELAAYVGKMIWQILTVHTWQEALYQRNSQVQLMIRP